MKNKFNNVIKSITGFVLQMIIIDNDGLCGPKL